MELELDDLAFATVRLLEGYAHAPSLTGKATDPEPAVRVLRAILR